MAATRVVVGATGDDATVREIARRLRDAGHEVIFVGGSQTPEQLVHTAVAEDADEIVVPTDDGSIARIEAARADVGADDIAVIAADDV